MTPCQYVPLEPAVAQMLAQHLHHPSVRRDVIVDGDDGFDRATILDGEDVPQPVRVRLIGAEEAEPLGLILPLKEITHHLPELPGGLVVLGGGLEDWNRVLPKVREVELYGELAAVRMRIGAHPLLSVGRQRGELRHEVSILVEEVLWLVAAHPCFEHLQVLWV